MLGQPLYKTSKLVSSPSRTYVAMCNKPDFDGYYFLRFVLSNECDNNCSTAAWYFLNILYGDVCLESCFPAEQFADVRDVIC